MQFDIGTVEDFTTSSKVFILDAYKRGLEFLSPFYHLKPEKIEELCIALRGREDYVGDVRSTSLIYFKTNTYYVTINTNSNVLTIIAKDIPSCKEFIQFYDSFLKTKESGSVGIDYFFIASHGVSRDTIDVNVDTMEPIYVELYPDINIDILCSDFISDKDSILFLAGVPGVGKTTFMRYLLQKCARRAVDLHSSELNLPGGRFAGSIAYVKDMQVMQQSQFWCELVSQKYDIIIFDDLDFGLASREGGENNIVSNLLSYSDGIFGSKAKIVVTTNMAITDIDKALLRPGRCFDFLVLNPLTRSDALNAWLTVLHLSKEDFEAQWPTAKEITQSDLMSVCYRIRESRKERKYVKNGLNIYNVEDKMKSMLSPVGFK